MIYLIIASIGVFMICLGFILQKQADEEQKVRDKPWRVVKNALGQYLLQNYQPIEKLSCDGRPFTTYEWKWVTVETFDDEQAAIIKYNYELGELQKTREYEKSVNEKMAKAKKEKELAETIVEIVK
jgi:hypothetical protein